MNIGDGSFPGKKFTDQDPQAIPTHTKGTAGPLNPKASESRETVGTHNIMLGEDFEAEHLGSNLSLSATSTLSPDLRSQSAKTMIVAGPIIAGQVPARTKASREKAIPSLKSMTQTIQSVNNDLLRLNDSFNPQTLFSAKAKLESLIVDTQHYPTMRAEVNELVASYNETISRLDPELRAASTLERASENPREAQEEAANLLPSKIHIGDPVLVQDFLADAFSTVPDLNGLKRPIIEAASISTPPGSSFPVIKLVVKTSESQDAEPVTVELPLNRDFKSKEMFRECLPDERGSKEIASLIEGRVAQEIDKFTYPDSIEIPMLNRTYRNFVQDIAKAIRGELEAKVVSSENWSQPEFKIFTRGHSPIPARVVQKAKGKEAKEGVSFTPKNKSGELEFSFDPKAKKLYVNGLGRDLQSGGESFDAHRALPSRACGITPTNRKATQAHVLRGIKKLAESLPTDMVRDIGGNTYFHLAVESADKDLGERFFSIPISIGSRVSQAINIPVIGQIVGFVVGLISSFTVSPVMAIQLSMKGGSLAKEAEDFEVKYQNIYEQTKTAVLRHPSHETEEPTFKHTPTKFESVIADGLQRTRERFDSNTRSALVNAQRDIDTAITGLGLDPTKFPDLEVELAALEDSLKVSDPSEVRSQFTTFIASIEERRAQTASRLGDIIRTVVSHDFSPKELSRSHVQEFLSHERELIGQLSAVHRRYEDFYAYTMGEAAAKTAEFMLGLPHVLQVRGGRANALEAGAHTQFKAVLKAITKHQSKVNKLPPAEQKKAIQELIDIIKTFQEYDLEDLNSSLRGDAEAILDSYSNFLASEQNRLSQDRSSMVAASANIDYQEGLFNTYEKASGALQELSRLHIDGFDADGINREFQTATIRLFESANKPGLGLGHLSDWKAQFNSLRDLKVDMFVREQRAIRLINDQMKSANPQEKERLNQKLRALQAIISKAKEHINTMAEQHLTLPSICGIEVDPSQIEGMKATLSESSADRLESLEQSGVSVGSSTKSHAFSRQALMNTASKLSAALRLGVLKTGSESRKQALVDMQSDLEAAMLSRRLDVLENFMSRGREALALPEGKGPLKDEEVRGVFHEKLEELETHFKDVVSDTKAETCKKLDSLFEKSGLTGVKVLDWEYNERTDTLLVTINLPELSLMGGNREKAGIQTLRLPRPESQAGNIDAMSLVARHNTASDASRLLRALKGSSLTQMSEYTNTRADLIAEIKGHEALSVSRVEVVTKEREAESDAQEKVVVKSLGTTASGFDVDDENDVSDDESDDDSISGDESPAKSGVSSIDDDESDVSDGESDDDDEGFGEMDMASAFSGGTPPSFDRKSLPGTQADMGNFSGSSFPFLTANSCSQLFKGVGPSDMYVTNFGLNGLDAKDLPKTIRSGSITYTIKSEDLSSGFVVTQKIFRKRPQEIAFHFLDSSKPPPAEAVEMYARAISSDKELANLCSRDQDFDIHIRKEAILSAINGASAEELGLSPMEQSMVTELLERPEIQDLREDRVCSPYVGRCLNKASSQLDESIKTLRKSHPYSTSGGSCIEQFQSFETEAITLAQKELVTLRATMEPSIRFELDATDFDAIQHHFKGQEVRVDYKVKTRVVHQGDRAEDRVPVTKQVEKADGTVEEVPVMTAEVLIVGDRETLTGMISKSDEDFFKATSEHLEIERAPLASDYEKLTPRQQGKLAAQYESFVKETRATALSHFALNIMTGNRPLRDTDYREGTTTGGIKASLRGLFAQFHVRKSAASELAKYGKAEGLDGSVDTQNIAELSLMRSALLPRIGIVDTKLPMISELADGETTMDLQGASMEEVLGAMLLSESYAPVKLDTEGTPNREPSPSDYREGFTANAMHQAVQLHRSSQREAIAKILKESRLTSFNGVEFDTQQPFTVREVELNETKELPRSVTVTGVDGTTKTIDVLTALSKKQRKGIAKACREKSLLDPRLEAATRRTPRSKGINPRKHIPKGLKIDPSTPLILSNVNINDSGLATSLNYSTPDGTTITVKLKEGSKAQVRVQMALVECQSGFVKDSEARFKLMTDGAVKGVTEDEEIRAVMEKYRGRVFDLSFAKSFEGLYMNPVEEKNLQATSYQSARNARSNNQDNLATAMFRMHHRQYMRVSFGAENFQDRIKADMRQAQSAASQALSEANSNKDQLERLPFSHKGEFISLTEKLGIALGDIEITRVLTEGTPPSEQVTDVLIREVGSYTSKGGGEKSIKDSKRFKKACKKAKVEGKAWSGFLEDLNRQISDHVEAKMIAKQNVSLVKNVSHQAAVALSCLGKVHPATLLDPAALNPTDSAIDECANGLVHGTLTFASIEDGQMEAVAAAALGKVIFDGGIELLDILGDEVDDSKSTQQIKAYLDKNIEMQLVFKNFTDLLVLSTEAMNSEERVAHIKQMVPPSLQPQGVELLMTMIENRGEIFYSKED